MSSLSASLRRRIERSPLAPAVVIGADVTGLAVARALEPFRVPVLGLCAGTGPYTESSSAFLTTIRMQEGFRDVPVLERLDRLADELPRRAALFLSMDQHVMLVGAKGQHLSERYAFEFPSEPVVDLLMDKQRFAARAEQAGWAVPRTFACNTPEEVADAAGAAVYPVILKPRVKHQRWAANSPRKVYRADSREALLGTYKTVAGWEKAVVIQEWIPGGDDEVYFSLHYLAADGREISGFEGRKIRQYPPGTGNTSSACPVATHRVRDLSLEILRATGAIGFCSVEYKRDPRTDRFYITEPTIGRINLQIGTAVANGANIPARAYFHLTGQPDPGESPPRRARIWVYVDRDLRSASYYVQRGELTWSGWLRSIAGPKAFAVWRPTDIGLLGGWLRYMTLRIARAIGRRIFPNR